MGLSIGTLVDGTPFELPDDVLTHTIAILAKKGAGKTYTAGVIEEEFAEHGLPFIVLDPVGVHYGIRSKANGRRSAYPIVVIGGEHGDIPIERTMGAQVAEAVVEENISCIIELSKTAWRLFTRDFCRELYRRNRNTNPRHVFIEEATEFIPQTRRPEMQEVYESVERLIRMGRNRGLGVTVISQRAATIAKDVLTQLDTLIALRTVGPQDRKAMLDMFEGVLEEDDLPTLELFKKEIARLPDGVAYIWSPEKLKCFEIINIRERKTYHGGATVQGPVGTKLVQARPDVSALRKRLAPPPEEQKDVPTKQEDQQQPAVCDHQQAFDDLHAEATRLAGKYDEAEAAVAEQTKELERYREDAAAFQQIRQLLTPAPLYQVTGDGEGNAHIEQIAPAIDEDVLVQKILARLPANGQAIQVTPPEALRKKFLNQAVERAYEKITALGDKPRRAMEVLLSNPIFWSNGAVAKAVGAGAGGSQAQAWREILKELLTIGLVKKGGKGGTEYKADVEAFVRAELSVHSATDQEVEQVVSHVLAKVATA